MELSEPKRFTVENVEIGVNYVLIISTSAGLWAYNTGDTISFTSLAPHKILVTGRYKHFISAFGEHVIANEVEKSLKKALEKIDLRVNEFTVAPEINPEKGLPFHQWWIEFDNIPNHTDLETFANCLDQNMQEYNT